MYRGRRGRPTCCRKSSSAGLRCDRTGSGVIGAGRWLLQRMAAWAHPLRQAPRGPLHRRAAPYALWALRRLGDRPSMLRVRLGLRHEFVHRNRPLLRVAVTTPFDDFSDGVHASSDEVERVARQVPRTPSAADPSDLSRQAFGFALSRCWRCDVSCGALMSDVSVCMRKACQHRIVRLIN